MNKKEKVICIGGGVGPMAGVDFHKKIIENTDSKIGDRGHFDVVHVSFSRHIPDRTKYLLGQESSNPAKGMFLGLEPITSLFDKKEVVLGIPCNTFHSPSIFDHFLNLIKQYGLNLKVVHMLEETALLIKEKYPQVKKVGLMSTTGTRNSGVYKLVFDSFGIEIVEVDIETQSFLHQSIYDNEWGIKALNTKALKARDNFVEFIGELKKKGVEQVILGCTEIPLILTEEKINGVSLVDPTFILAKALIREAS